MSPSTRRRIPLVIIVVLLGVIAAMAYKFIVVGSVAKGDDGRVAVVLESGERAFVLREMRAFVAGVQRISAALARDDPKAAAAAARQMGMGAAHDAPPAILAKLPLGFKTMAFAVHRGFDAMALDAESLGDTKHTLSQLADTLGKCVECHNAYEFRTPPSR